MYCSIITDAKEKKNSRNTNAVILQMLRQKTMNTVKTHH